MIQITLGKSIPGGGDPQTEVWAAPNSRVHGRKLLQNRETRIWRWGGYCWRNGGKRWGKMVKVGRRNCKTVGTMRCVKWHLPAALKPSLRVRKQTNEMLHRSVFVSVGICACDTSVCICVWICIYVWQHVCVSLHVWGYAYRSMCGCVHAWGEMRV